MIKAAAHLHSTFSYDGKLPLPELRALLQKGGIQCALMSEHTDGFTPAKAAEFFAACAAESTPSFLFIPGFEVAYKNAHVLMLGVQEFIQPDDLGLWKEASALAVLAHPHRNDYKLDERLRTGIDAVEVWNSQYDGKHSPRPRAEALLRDEQKNKPLRAWWGFDLHRAAHAGGPWIAIDADTLTPQAVLAALCEGRYTLGARAGGYWRGVFDRMVISAGRKTNALLKTLGIKLPRTLTEPVRTSV